MQKVDPFWVAAFAAELESKSWMRFSACDSLARGLWTIYQLSVVHFPIQKWLQYYFWSY